MVSFQYPITLYGHAIFYIHSASIVIIIIIIIQLLAFSQINIDFFSDGIFDNHNCNGIMYQHPASFKCAREGQVAPSVQRNWSKFSRDL